MIEPIRINDNLIYFYWGRHPSHANMDMRKMRSYKGNWSSAILVRTNLNEANLEKINLTGAVLINVQFEGTNLAHGVVTDAVICETLGSFNVPWDELLDGEGGYGHLMDQNCN